MLTLASCSQIENKIKKVKFIVFNSNKKNSDALTSHHNRLNNIFENSLVNQNIILIIIDTSVKNNVATLVVATTRRNSTCDMQTSAKLSNGLSSSGVYKRTQQGALAVLLLYLYYYIVVRATTICLSHVHPPCFYLMSYYSSTCVFLKATMLPTCALTSYL